MTTIDTVGVFQNVTVAAIVPYLPSKETATGTCLLICPGGGYSGLAWQNHVQLLAPLFTSKGVAVIGLRYRTHCEGNTIPEDPVADFNQAIRLVRANAEVWNLDPDKIVGMGFSAGSNLLLQYACAPEGEPIQYLNFLCLWPYFREAETYSIQKQDLDVVLFTTGDDQIAAPSFSVEMTQRFMESGAKAQLVTYPKGSHMAFNFYGHGPTVDWTKDFLAWLETRGLLEQAEK
jgi:acetyl esterase/lipase